ncbi:MAG: helix-turn-helix domain-containing protein [Gemmatimonadales bacterium]|nr:helix-turn-helix domain-containing protein [Gemmatimonadales bacterium]
MLIVLLGAAPDVATAVGPDPTVVDLAHRFGRSPSTIRWWIESNRFPGAYRFRGKEWRVPAAAVAAFEADERARRTPAPIGAASEGAGAVVDLGAWRRVG